MSIIEEIGSLEDAYAYLGLKQEEEIPFANPKNDRQESANAFMNAMVLTEALNEGRKPDFDSYENKYTIWWDLRSEAAGGPGFSCGVYDCDYSYSDVGARLVYHRREVAKYAGENFPEVYKPFMTFPEDK